VTANNVANVSTVGFKRSRTDFGDIFATSPLQKATATIGQGVALKRVSQEFGQGNLNFSSNTLDLAISGDGFFPLKSQDGFQDIFTRNGSFMMNDQYNVVNSAGQKLMAASVDSSGKANLTDMNVLTIPQKTTSMAKQTSKIQLGLNFPADAPVIEGNFNRNDPTTYSKSSAMTVYDAGGNSYLATIYYAKTLNASAAVPNNRWQTYVYVGDNLVSASLQQATDKSGQLMFVNKYGQLKSAADFTTPDDIAALNSSFSKKTIKFSLDQLTNTQISQPATITAGVAANMGTGSNDGVDIGSYLNMTKSSLLRQQGCSAATYALDPNVVGPVSVTFGPANNPVVVTIPANGAQAPGPLDIASALNANSSFVASYVAEASHTSASISNINFDNLAPAVLSNPFSSFSINVGGQQFNIDNLSSTDINLTSLAADLQAKLRARQTPNPWPDGRLRACRPTRSPLLCASGPPSAPRRRARHPSACPAAASRDGLTQGRAQAGLNRDGLPRVDRSTWRLM
jgi:flagellar hook-basal body protein